MFRDLFEQYGKTAIIIATMVLLLGTMIYMGLQTFSNSKNLKERDEQIATLQTKLDNIGTTTTVYVLNAPVKTGKKVEEADLKQIDVPTKLVEKKELYDKEKLLTLYYKQDLDEGDILSSSNLYEFQLTDDMRLLDVVVDEMPVGLQVGNYVDIRISFAFGQEYIALTQKRVEAIHGGVLKLVANQQDIHTYESMKTDKALYEGTVIRAVQYLEPGIQSAAINYYPISTTVLNVLLEDPNTSKEVSNEMVTKRRNLEKVLTTGLTKEVEKVLAKQKATFTSALDEAAKTLAKQLEAEAKAAAKANRK